MFRKSVVSSLFVSFVSLSNYAAAQSSELEAPSPTPVATEESWFEKQNALRKKKMEAAVQYRKNTRFCAAPTYTRKEGKWVVLYEGKCETGGFSGGDSKTSLSDRKSKL